MFEQFTPVLGRNVWLRENTSDEQVHADTFGGAGGYHVPPSDMAVPEFVLDLGANVGLTAAHYKALWPDAQVVAVEMDARCCELARRNAPGVQVIHAAVAGEGIWGSYRDTARAEAFIFEPGVSPYGSDREGVVAYTLRSIIENRLGWDHVDFLKADIEGSEHGLFAHGSWAPLVRAMLVELHPDDDHPDDSAILLAEGLAALERLGFRASHHERHPRAVWAVKP